MDLLCVINVDLSCTECSFLRIKQAALPILASGSDNRSWAIDDPETPGTYDAWWGKASAHVKVAQR
jgi:hypothetical protein